MPKVGVSMNALQFESELNKWATRLVPSIGKKIHGAVTEATYLGIVQKTPVLTARARGNWIPTLGSPSLEWGDHLNAGVSMTGVPPTGAERGAAKAIKSQLEVLALGSTISYITNNLEYIEGLEDGTISMKTAPNAMVQGTIINTLDGLKVDVILKGIR